MSSNAAHTVQHCPSCATEFEWWVRACSDCGAGLQPGPLPQTRNPADEAPPAVGEVSPAPQLDRLLVKLPGTQADHLARALAMAEIPSLLECEGIVQVHRPGHEAGGPLAASLPVAVYVATSDIFAASEIMESLTHDGNVESALAIGVDPAAIEAEALQQGDAMSVPAEPPRDEGESDIAPPAAESMTGRVFLLLALAAVVLLLVLAGN